VRAGYGDYWQRQLFVLLNAVEQKVVGVSGLERESSLALHYYLESNPSRLHLTAVSPCTFKIGSLLLDTNYRGLGLGKLLSLSRFLYIADVFRDIRGCVQAELRGSQENDGMCSFWLNIGQSIYGGDLARMDMIRGTNYSLFCDDFGCMHDIPLDFLPGEIRQSIGKVHRGAMGAWRMLYAQGFRPSGYIDMLDGGPVIKADFSDISAIKNSFVVSARCGHKLSPYSSRWMIMSRSAADYRVCIAAGSLRDEWLELEDSALDILGISPGETVRALSIDEVKKDDAL
jgi:arginine N-succinyltransferase